MQNLTTTQILNTLALYGFKAFNVLITLILITFIIGAFYKPLMVFVFSLLQAIFKVNLHINLNTI